MAPFTFKLPVVDVDTSPADAVGVLIKEERSALIARDGNVLRLLDKHALIDALANESSDLRALTRYVLPGLLLRSDGNVVASHSYLAARYIKPPRIVRCANPTAPHFYPPNERDPSRPAQCVLCPFKLPA